MWRLTQTEVTKCFTKKTPRHYKIAKEDIKKITQQEYSRQRYKQAEKTLF